MKKPQFLKFCKAIANSTSMKETISAFKNKKGYGGKRTLERCSQAATGFKERLPSEVIAQRTGWSVKYVDKIRSWWEEEFPLHEQQSKQITSNPRLMKHLDELAKTAESLAHQCQRLLRYKDNANVEAMGDVCGHLFFWWKPNKTIVEESTDSTGEFRYESKHPIDPYLARLLYIHYEDEFGKPPFKEWNRLSTGNVSCEIVDNLKFLAHGGLKPCQNCPICLQR